MTSNSINITASSPINSPQIHRGRIESFSLYEITEHELAQLEAGTPSSLYLNFSIFFFSIASSFFISLVTTDISSIKIFTIFAIIVVIGFIAAAVLGAIWWKTRTSLKAVIHEIRNRIPPDANG